MGRQTEFHMLPTDLEAFLSFVQNRDPIIVTSRDSDSPDVKALANPASETEVMILWNQELLSSIQRTHIVAPGRKCFTIDSSTPTIELLPSLTCEWNGRDALLSGRIYSTFENQSRKYVTWYNSLVRWIRTNFVRSPVPHISYVGPAAYEWYRRGGLLLPMMIPPAVTPAWLSWVEAQDQQRALFSR